MNADSSTHDFKPLPEELVEVQHELITMVAAHTFFRVVLVLVASCVMAYFAANSGRVPTTVWASWFAISLMLELGRWLLPRWLPMAPSLSHEEKVNWLIWTMALNGLTKGLACFIFPYIGLYERSIITMITIGASSIVVSSTFGYRPIAIAYVSTAMLPLFATWIINPVMATFPGAQWYEIVWQPGWIEAITGVVGFGYAAALIASGDESFQRFETSLIMRRRVDKLNHRLEETLNEAEQANMAKTRFLAAASHDLRQPIHTLSLFSAALNLQNLDAKSRQIVNHMTASLEVLSSQLDRLLDISKLDAGIVEVNATEVDLAITLARLHKEFEMLADSRSLYFLCQAPPGSFIRTDPTLLELILRNLIENAFKYTQEGGVTVTAQLQDTYYRISISDTGCGIAPGDRGKVFEEFYQVGNYQRDRTKGLGLGLAIVKRLVGLLHLQIELTSQPGVGSRFELVILQAARLSGSAAGVPAIRASEAMLINNLNVLVLDDEVSIREGMKILLEAKGWAVVTSESIDAALQAVRQFIPDVLLVDFRLANGANGIDAIARIRELVGAVPAILISGDTAPQRLREATEAGIPLLTKPVSAAVLEASIIDMFRPNKEELT